MNIEKKQVTERDFRCPEYIDANPDDYEFRSDGKLVRKDRWKSGIFRIAYAIGFDVREFEIDDVVNRIETLLANQPKDKP